jgi:hypothetical protein
MSSVVHPTTDIPANGSFAPEAAGRKSNNGIRSALHSEADIARHISHA